LRCNLRKGDIAEETEIHIGLPSNFSFIGQETYTLDSNHAYPNYIVMTWEIPKIIRGLDYNKTIKIKTPSEKSKYIMIIYKYCKGSFTEKAIEREVIVN
jgi:hypothetical protein